MERLVSVSNVGIHLIIFRSLNEIWTSSTIILLAIIHIVARDVDTEKSILALAAGAS